MYDPVIALFISADSVDQDWYDPQSLNRYAYCRNNQLKYVDPDGHDFRQASYFDPVSRQIVNKPPQKIRPIVDIRIGKSFRLRLNPLTFTLSIAAGRIPGIGLPTGVAGPKTASAAKANAIPPKSGVKAPDFIVSPKGTAYPVPKGAQGPKPVINPQGKQTGTAFTGGKGGANEQVDTMRIMDPTSPRGESPGSPKGYIKYENVKKQGVNPYTGKTGSKPATHFDID